MMFEKDEQLGRLVVVVASAGTGKTTRLTDDFDRALAACDFDGERVLAITFTENAAVEMKERITERVVSRLGLDGVRVSYGIRVSTVDAFCRREISRHAFLLGLTPEFTVLEESEARRLQRAVLMRVIKAMEEEDSPHLKAIVRNVNFSSYFQRHEHGQTLESSILELYARLRAYEVFPFEGLCLKVRKFDGEGAIRRLTAACQRALALEPSSIGSAKSAEVLRRVQSAIGRCSIERAPDDDEKLFFELVDLCNSFHLNVSAEVKEVLREVRSSAVEVLDWIVSRRDRELRDGIVTLLSRFDAEYQADKRRAKALDFADMGIYFLRLLEEHPDVKDKYRERLVKVFVDEYQDLNPLQMRIVDGIAGEGATYLVGDPRQSIYRFRYAEPSGITAKVEECEKGYGSFVSLRRNYRSRPEILRFVNTLFGRVVEGDLGRGLGFRFEAMESGMSFSAKRDKSVVLYCHSPAVSRKKPADRLDLEARQVAVHIREAVERGAIPVSRGDATGTLGYGDFALLCRRTTHLPIFEKALSELGVPFVSESGRGFFETVETRTVTDLLQLLMTEDVDELCARVLRGDLLGVSTETLFQLVARQLEEGDHHGGDDGELGACDERSSLSLLEVVKRHFAEVSSGADALVLGEFVQWYNDLRGNIGDMRACEILESVVTRGRLREKWAGYGASISPVFNLEKLMNLALSTPGYGYEAIGNLLTHIYERRYQRSRVSQMWMAEGDFVRVLTVHGAKGLTFGAVVVADVNFKAEGEDSPFVLAKEGEGVFRLGIKHRLTSIARNLLGGGVKVSDVSWEEIRDEYKRKGEEEELRLLYVALTRAVEHLAIVGVSPRENVTDALIWGVPLARVLAEDSRELRVCPWFEDLVELRMIDEEHLRQHSDVGAVPDILELASILEREVAEEDRGQARLLLDVVSQAPDLSNYGRYIYSVTEIVRDWAKEGLGGSFRLEADKREDLVGEWQEDEYLAGERGWEGRQIGALVHKLLAKGCREWGDAGAEGFLASLFSRETLAGCGLAVDDREVIRKARKLVSAFAGTEVFELMRLAEWRKVEHGLVTFVGGCLVQGKVDLLFLTDGVAHLVEFKTDDIGGIPLEALVDAYRPQLLIYAYMVSKLLPGIVIKPHLIFLGFEKVMSLNVNADDFAQMEAKVERYLNESKRADTIAFEMKVRRVGDW